MFKGDWTKETPLIFAAAFEYGVDPYFIAAIRKAENGDAGKEFGVLSESEPTYEGQLNACCATVRHQLAAVHGANPLDQIQGPKVHRVCYSDVFINVFRAIWAPANVVNDPNNLNANWVKDVSTFYKTNILLGRIV